MSDQAENSVEVEVIEAVTEPSEGQLAHVYDEATLARSIEAILMVVDEPVTEITLATVLEVTVDQVVAALNSLAGSYGDRGFTLKAINGGWRFYSAPEFSSVVEKFVLDGQQNRLTQAALETLAVIAYRQPVSRARVSAIRGVNVEAVMKTLITRGLVDEYGIENETGAILYKTTSYFLERLGLNRLEDLPPLAPHLPDIDGLDEILDSLTD
jgi:segregation and condensation protein B